MFRYRQSNVRRLLPASDYRARGNQIVEHSWDNETVLGISRKLGGAAEHLIDGREKKTFVGWALSFRVRMLLKGAVKERLPLHYNYSRLQNLQDINVLCIYKT